MSATGAGPRDVTALTDAADQLGRMLEELRTDPVLELLATPGSCTLRFPYAGDTMILIARNPRSLANIGRALRITRSRRHGRRGARTWETGVRPDAQLPKPTVPHKSR